MRGANRPPGPEARQAAGVPSAFHGCWKGSAVGSAGGSPPSVSSSCPRLCKPILEGSRDHRGALEARPSQLQACLAQRSQDSREQDWRRKSWILPASWLHVQGRGESLLGFCSEALFYPQILSLCGFFGDHSEEFLFFLQAYRPVSSFMSVLFSLHLGNQCISK